jgi:hypothetical protein
MGKYGKYGYLVDLGIELTRVLKCGRDIWMLRVTGCCKYYNNLSDFIDFVYSLNYWGILLASPKELRCLEFVN